MKNAFSVIAAATLVAVFLVACWNPSVAEVPITAPWNKMNLPVRENARVWFSDEKELRVAHRGRRADIADSYLAALDKDGWKTTEEPLMDENIIVNKMAKNDRRIMVKFNDFEGGTGVVITRLE